MDYQRHYDRLIGRAFWRTLEGYSEQHHILPRCLGGTNARSNIVRLTAEEHYVAHQLLVKIYPGNHRLLWAVIRMTGGSDAQPGRRGNKAYGWLRRRFAQMVGERSRGRKMPPEFGQKVSERQRGKKRGPHSAETKAKMSAASKGRPKSADHKLALAVAKTGKRLPKASDETRRKMSVSIRRALRDVDKSHMQSPTYREAQSLRMKEIWAKRKEGIQKRS